MKKLISIITAVLILICFSTASAHADRKTVERIMIGTGIGILGAAIAHGVINHSKPQYSRQQSRYNDHNYTGYKDRHRHKRDKKYCSSEPHRPRGHYETEKTWIEPVYETKWNPGHYNRRGDWINGRYEKFTVQKGYWKKNKVWIWH